MFAALANVRLHLLLFFFISNPSSTNADVNIDTQLFLAFQPASVTVVECWCMIYLVFYFHLALGPPRAMYQPLLLVEVEDRSACRVNEIYWVTMRVLIGSG